MTTMDKQLDDMDFEIQFYEGLLKKKPDYIDALSALADLYTKRGFFRKGLMIDEKLAKIKPDDPTVLYNLACSYSLVNDTDRAFRTIKKAIRYGYDDIRYMEKDDDLQNLRSDQRFQRYLNRIKDKD